MFVHRDVHVYMYNHMTHSTDSNPKGPNPIVNNAGGILVPPAQLSHKCLKVPPEQAVNHYRRHWSDAMTMQAREQCVHCFSGRGEGWSGGWDCWQALMLILTTM